MQKATGTLYNSRIKYTEDMGKLILYLQSLSHQIILCGDVNDDMNDSTSANKWREMLKLCDMSVVTDFRFPSEKLPATYERSHRCLDMVAISSNIPQSAVTAVGYLPFCNPLPSDHRAIFVDFDANALFGTHIPDLTRSSFKHFSTRNMRQANKYLDNLRKHYKVNNMYDKVCNLKQEILSADELKYPTLIYKCKQLEKKSRELMVASEKKLYKGKYQSAHWSSRKLVNAAATYLRLKKQRRYMLNRPYSSEEYEDMENKVAEALIHLKDSQENSRKLRDEELEYNANELSKDWKATPEQVKKILLNAEKSQKLFRKLKGTMKNNNISSLKHLLVPKPCIEPGSEVNDDDDPSHRWVEVMDPDKVFEITLQTNARNLMRSNQAISAEGPFKDRLGFQAENEVFIQDLLNGKIDAAEISQSYPDVAEELEEFLKASANTNRKDMSWSFDVDEYQQLFKKTRESTACGPSGLHMSHWKVAALDDELSAINAFFMWASFYLGFVYDRWLISWHCMLLKKRHPYVNKLRIIQLFEGDFNGMLKFLLGRQLMRHMVQTDQIDVTTFGSIPGRDAKEAMKLLDMVYSNHRLFSRTLVSIFNDAAGCYDRIRPNMADIAMRRVGCPASITNTQTRAQLGMVHKIRTALGVSKGTLKWGPGLLTTIVIAGIIHLVGNIGGIGQGGGGSPVGWLVILLIMIRAYHQFSPGAKIVDPYGLYSFSLHVISYVDDNSLLRSFPPNTSWPDIFTTVSNELTSWWKLLRITGGDLALEKCTYSVMAWTWDGIYNTRKLLRKENIPGDVRVTPNGEDPITIQCIDSNTAERQLGFRLSMDGNWDDEFEFRCSQMKRLCSKVYGSNLTNFEAWMAYQFYVKSTLYFALPVTVFTYHECVSLNKIILNKILPACGINRNTPRALIYAPQALGGFEYDHVWTKQLILHVEMIQRHLRRQDSLGMSILCNFNSLQLLTGRSQPFIQLDPTRHKYVDQSGCIGMLWNAFFSLHIKCVIPKLILPSTTHPNDKIIMDVAVSDNMVCHNLRKLEAINNCRMYHGITSVSNMMQYTGHRLNMGFLSPNGGRRISKSHLHQWPILPVPTPWQWATWKEFIFRNFLTGARELAPISPNTRPIFSPCTNIRKDLEIFTSIQYSTLSDSINALPMGLRYYLGDIHFDTDHEQVFVDALSQGDLTGATDGSAHTTSHAGSFAFVLSLTSNMSNIIFGGGKVAHLPCITSQVTEHYGAIGFLLLVLCLQSCTGQSTLPPLSVWIDNDNTVTRLNSTPLSTGSTSQYSSADFDLWQLILLIQSYLDIQVTAYWVKAHQDDKQSPEDLSAEARLNILADSIANNIYLSQSSLPPRLPHDDEGLHISHQGIQITNVDAQLRKLIHEPDYCTYICEKRHWDITVYSAILWDSLGSALDSFTKISRQNIIQLIHNWQHTGDQKRKFFYSSMQSSDAVMREASEKYVKSSFLCPTCKVSIETAFHFVTCEKVVSKDEVVALRNQLVKSLRQLNTFDGISDILIYLLRGHDFQHYQWTCPENMLSLWHTALQDQSKVGWMGFLQGFWHSSWKPLQGEHIKKAKVGQDSDQWMTSVLKHLLQYDYECWKLRNVQLHGTDTSEETTANLHAHVRRLYLDPDRFLFHTKEKRRLFHLPLQKRLKCSNATLESWIDLVETRLRLDREEHAKRTLIRWLGDKDSVS